MKKTYIVILIIVIAVFIFRSYKFYTVKTSKSVERNGVIYQATKIDIKSENFELILSGKVEAGSNVAIISESIGKIKQRMIDFHALVHKNQPLFEIEDTLDSINTFDKIDIPEIETSLDQSYQTKTKKYSKKQTKSITGRYIVAPCNGYLRDILIDSGANVGNGTIVASIACLSNIFITSGISIANAKFISKGNLVQISSDDVLINAKISNISRVMNSNGIIKFNVNLKKSDSIKLFIDQDVDMKIIGKKLDIAKIPSSAITLNKDKSTAVFVIRNDVASLTKIQIISEDGGFSNVIGLAKDDIIIINALNLVKNNEKIKYVII